jgi:hypothetical protein
MGKSRRLPRELRTVYSKRGRRQKRHVSHWADDMFSIGGRRHVSIEQTTCFHCADDAAAAGIPRNASAAIASKRPPFSDPAGRGLDLSLGNRDTARLAWHQGHHVKTSGLLFLGLPYHRHRGGMRRLGRLPIPRPALFDKHKLERFRYMECLAGRKSLDPVWSSVDWPAKREAKVHVVFLPKVNPVVSPFPNPSKMPRKVVIPFPTPFPIPWLSSASPSPVPSFILVYPVPVQGGAGLPVSLS